MGEISTWLLPFVLGGLVWLWWQRAYDRWLRKRRSRVAARGEKRAEALLKTKGYVVLDRQVRTRCSLCVDREAIEFDLVADLLVQSDGKVFVAEVKTGAGRTIRHSGTRRQLLEYALSFDVDGVLLVDPTRSTVQRIEFHFQASRILAA